MSQNWTAFERSDVKYVTAPTPPPDGNPRWAFVTELLGLLPEGVVIAGSWMAACYGGPGEPHDVDIFFAAAPKQIHITRDRLRIAAGYREAEVSGPGHIDMLPDRKMGGVSYLHTAAARVGYPNIQLMEGEYDGAPHVLDSFDFVCCQVAATILPYRSNSRPARLAVYHHPDALVDIADRRLRHHRLNKGNDPLGRVRKYEAKGYRYDGDKEQLADAVAVLRGMGILEAS